MSRRAALSLARQHLVTSQPRNIAAIRCFSFTPNPVPQSAPTPTLASTPSSKSKKAVNSEPTPYTQPPVFPAPKDPFEKLPETAPQHSEATKNFVRGIARLMGYNSQASTAIRETGRMMRGIVEAVEADRAFWYGDCKLPSTYQTFFQLHLLYVLILLPRLRSLPAASPSTQHPVPEPLDPSPPEHTVSSTSTASSSETSGTPILSKPNHDAYPTEFLSHFFELAESEMRQILGRGERERVVKKYMSEMAEQWKGAGIGLDYVLGLSHSEDPAEVERADLELASWVWRNLLASRGLMPASSSLAGVGAAPEDEEMAEQIELIVRFVRRELKRIDNVDDYDVLNGNVGDFGRVKQ